MKNVLPPFRTIFVKNSDYIVNGGKIVNYFNPINYQKIRRDRDDNFLNIITDTLESEDVFSFSGLKKVEIYLMCSFKAPKYWIPGPRFCPIIDNAWIVRKETENDDDIIIQGSIENSSVDHIRFDSALDIQYGYACNLGKISEIELVDGEYVVRQVLIDNYDFSLLFSTPAYTVHNNLINILPNEDSMAAYSLIYNNQNTFLYRGYAITSNTSFVNSGEDFWDDPLPANTLPPIIGSFVESHPEL